MSRSLAAVTAESKSDFSSSPNKSSNEVLERRFRDFLENYLPKTPGAIVDTSGREIGRHEGLVF